MNADEDEISETSHVGSEASTPTDVIAAMYSWNEFLGHLVKAKSAQPSERWLRILNQHIASIGEEEVVRAVVYWFEEFVAPSRRAESLHFPSIAALGGTPEQQMDMLRGLAWCCIGRDDPKLSRSVSNLTEAALKKIPGRGPRSLKLGNAGIYVLSTMPGMHATVQLGRLRQRVLNAQSIRGIDYLLDEAAKRLGQSRDDLDDMLTPTFELVDGRRKFEFAPFCADLVAGGPAGVEIRWLGPDGVQRRSEPAEVKQRYREERQELRAIADDLKKSLTAQRTRLEGMFLKERSWSLAVWRERYLDHPLLSDLARRLIWIFEHDGLVQTGAWLDGDIVDEEDRPLDNLSANTVVRLWHPINATHLTTSAWQSWLERHELRQPFKQAHREIYVLTDAERTTATYSNRFASHILRRQQFGALARGRGWNYNIGEFVYDSVNPTVELPEWQLAVEFFMEPVFQEEVTDDFMPLFVATDQVRFLRTGADRRNHFNWDSEAVPVTEIPPIVFSEVLRDVDLFVGVASVGADPLWHDRGPQGVREYWSSYAFGDLSASAKTRRIVLERLIPRLAIAPRCELEERFLVVRGDLRNYRIHLGSGNIQMEPNNEYLCIVAQRSGKPGEPGIFLPFEGDALLSTILSKAFMLSNDHAISDPTITRQIVRSQAGIMP